MSTQRSGSQQDAIASLRSMLQGSGAGVPDDDMLATLLEVEGWDVTRAARLVEEDNTAERRRSGADDETIARSFAQDPQVRGSMDFEQPLIDASRRSFNGGAGSLGGLAGGAGLRRYPGPGDNNGPSSVAQMIWTALTLPFSVASSLLLFLARVLRLRSLLPSLFGNGGGSQGSSASDPRTSAERFVRELEMETGGTTSRSGPPAGQDPQADGFDTGSSVLKRLPPFFVGSYTDALRQAKEQIKILAIVLVSREHGDVDRFKQHTLTDNELVELLSRDDFIVWGGDVREREAYTVARTLQASTYPFVAFIALQPPRQSSRAAAASSGSSPRPAVLSRLEGSPSSATSAASIASHISDVLLPRTRVYMDRLRAERRRREMERELRAEQDRAYQEASRRDAERIAQRREEERRKAVEAQRRREEQEQKEELQRRQQIWRRWASNNLVPQEPGATHEAVRFSFRLPSGKTLARRFSPLDPVEAVFAYVESASVALEASEAEGEVRKPEGYEHTYRFSLVTGYPRKRIEFGDAGASKLRDVEGLAQGASLIVEGHVLGDAAAATDDEDDDDDDDGDATHSGVAA
ncbi:predicted regulator of the ubiquitin pathway [Moesziomyces antarcticus T-34]|uniref:Predicted regulator of the ubiquitin pathway n=1 Tax=Pseudozyma antarctica (strain T-34) TaxID=1151754 RepID=M9LT96_PSEA3|nr:predicted regulator of the ubiquitin pathway [Moesziomyces antarcticus T-34]